MRVLFSGGYGCVGNLRFQLNAISSVGDVERGVGFLGVSITNQLSNY